MNIWKSPLTEQRGGRERKHASSNCVCWLGGYMIDRASRVLVVIPLRRSRASMTDLTVAVTGDVPGLSLPTLQRQAGVKLTPQAASCARSVPVPHYHHHIC